MPTRARETYTNILRNRTPVGDRTEFLPVKFENSHVIGDAKVRRALDHSLQRRPEAIRRLMRRALCDQKRRALGPAVRIFMVR